MCHGCSNISKMSLCLFYNVFNTYKNIHLTSLTQTLEYFSTTKGDILHYTNIHE